jgi:hypothetical protein
VSTRTRLGKIPRLHTPPGHGEVPAKQTLSARSGEVGAATEILLTNAEQVSDDAACAAG